MDKPLTSKEVHDLEARYVPNGDVYPLWGFSGARGVVVTRGRTSSEAWEYVKDDFWREVVEEMKIMPVTYGKIYSQNHREDWLFRPPVWVLRKMFGV